MTAGCILIVEADVLVRHPLAEYLRDCGYQVIEAVSAEEARALLTSGTVRIDSVLADADAAGPSVSRLPPGCARRCQTSI